MESPAKPERIAPMIHWIRGEKVMLDRDLARLYGVETRVLKQAVRRNRGRFPEDFMFTLSDQEFAAWRSQLVMSKPDRQGLRHPPMAFTEQGVAMLSSVLRCERAVQVNIAIMRTFVQLRRLMDANRELADKIHALEGKYDQQFAIVFEAIRQLLSTDEARRKAPARRAGFHPDEA